MLKLKIKLILNLQNKFLKKFNLNLNSIKNKQKIKVKLQM